MKIYIVMEGPDLPAPDNPADTVRGVFLSKEAAFECLEHHCRHVNSLNLGRMFRKHGKVHDEYGHIYFQVGEFKIGFCRMGYFI